MKVLENKISPPLLFAIFCLAMLGAARGIPTHGDRSTVRIAAVAVLVVLGAICSAPAILAFRRADTSINPVHIDRASVLVSRGIYRVTRNPMYLGLILQLTALAVFLSVPWLLAAPLLFAAYITRFQIMPEERMMELKFGKDYLDYKARVRRWI